ncbi:IST1-like protein [Tanacetum coccineum]
MAAFRKGVEAETSGRIDDERWLLSEKELKQRQVEEQMKLRFTYIVVSRLSFLKNQHQARLSLARSDIVQLLSLGHHEHALLRVDQVIKEENVLDVYVMLYDYCHLVLQMFNLIEQEKDCPHELKEAASSLLYAAPRCGEFPELQEIRVVLTARYGKEFANGAIDLRNNGGVSTRMIQKLSPRKSSLETRMKILNEIATENDIVLKLYDSSSVLKQGEGESKTNVIETILSVSADDFDEVLRFTESRKGRNKYRNAEDAAQDVFESAAYAAATTARSAVELSRSWSFCFDKPDSPNTPPRKVLEKPKLEIPEPELGPEHEMVNVEAADETSKNNTKDTSGIHLIVDKPMENNVVFDESDNEIENEPVGFMSSKQLEFDSGNIEPRFDKGSKASSTKYFPFSKHGFIDFKRHEWSRYFDAQKSSKEHKGDYTKLMTKEETSNRERGIMASIRDGCSGYKR